MPNEIIVVETPAYETRTVYGTQATETTCSDKFDRFLKHTAEIPPVELVAARDK